MDRLLVDAPCSGLGVLARRIGEAGYRVATAENAQRAMAELHRLPIDIVVSELRLPVTSGVELVRMIREDSAHRDIPIFLITGKSDADGAVQAYRCGADAVIANDPDADRIAVCIKSRDGARYETLSGNDVGVLLSADALVHADTKGKQKLVITTIVSSTWLSRIAHDLAGARGS